MPKILSVVVVALLLIPGFAAAQQAGSFIAGLDVGLTSAAGDFRNDTAMYGGSGVGFGAELRYTILNNFSVGPFVKYARFGSDQNLDEGNVSFNFTQLGALARLNLFNLQSGKFYLFGGGGQFTPNMHLWTPDYTEDQGFESDMFYTGGIGLCSNPYSTTIYEIEARYSTGDANVTTTDFTGFSQTFTRNFDFIYVGMKLSFNFGGKEPPPRY